MNTAINSLLSILDLEQLEHNLFRGRSPQAGWQRVYGGQVIGQALVAASRTVVEERHIHSLHGYFLRPGDPAVPIIYDVDRIRDGGSFTTRRVVAIQHGQAIFSMSASFQTLEDGLEHQTGMPDVPMPEDLPSEQDLKEKFLKVAPENVRRYWERERPIELRPVDLTHYFSEKKLAPQQYVWVRATSPLPDETRIHQCVLAYASDMTLLDTSLFPHGKSVFSPQIQAASLDHSMWFHRPFRADDWLLYATDAPSSSGGRGMNRGLLYDRSGHLIASTAQEGLIRLKRS
ncbi:acyl-CoA thioesterase II [Pannonibacter phragmitetus]|uniref:Acyl-CoA thioesterase 2 n=1 Tax=Pannonibacter phragmitetus TaxID=121719 RepID=A0A0U3PGM2_9HYPH|nr:acyl-CoA thioesterase II [Pannonibacter phragmitetus]ALV26812.1 acyl-CoA thioesterase II [Pannonibacter phragmitetus]SUB03074.1 Acyl-CoA thioesterase 2 [Pannonibacter phragmitetus]